MDYAVGSSPISVFIADLDRDGDNDLAVANLFGRNVSVLLNNGAGTFAPKVDYAVENDPSSVFISDLDGDGYNDLAVANKTSDNVSVLLNNGAGTFAPKVDYGTGANPTSVFIADFDGDGDNDLAVANETSDNVSVLLNNGAGTFAPKVDYGTGANPFSVFSLDLDGDGDDDLATGNFDDNTVSVLLNNGNGTFADKVDYPAGDGPISVFIADFDGDGDNDLAVSNGGSGIGTTISVLLNNGDGTFAFSRAYPAGNGPVSVFSADFDGDGDNDLAVANQISGDVSVLLNLSDTPSPPIVTSIDSTSGPELGGTPVTITGSNFQIGATVTFDDSAATNVLIQPLGNTIAAVTPAHPAGPVDVIVTNPSGEADTLVNGFTFLPAPTPVVTSIDPTSGSEFGGTPVTITGSNFQIGATATFDDSAATNVLVALLGDTITAVTPVHPPGPVDVIVTNPSGQADTLLNGFTFLSATPPVVTSINPTSGTEFGGTPVAITGSNFQSGATVTFDDIAATNVLVALLGDTITAVTPAHPADSVDVIVTNPSGLADTLSYRFEFIADSAVVTIGAGAEIASPGGHAVVPIFSSNLTGRNVFSVEITLRFDPAFVQFMHASPGPGHDFPSGFFFNSPEPGRAIIAFGSITPLLDTPAGILAFAVFEVNASASLGSRIDIFVPEDRAIVNEGFPPVTTFNGNIIVGIVGDISGNGDVRAFDAVLALMHSVGIRNIRDEFFGGDEGVFLAISDVTRNLEVTSFDAVRILQFVVELIPGLPYLGTDGPAKVADVSLRTVGFSDASRLSKYTLKVPLSIDDMSGVLGADISITYDSSKLKAVGVSPSGMLSSFVFQSNIVDDKVRIAFASAYPVEGGGDMAYIQFEVVDGLSDELKDDLLKISGVQLNEGLIPAIIDQSELSLDESSTPETYALSQNFPNPFNPTTTIRFAVRPDDQRTNVELSVYNLSGQRIRTLISGKMESGEFAVTWDGKDEVGKEVASGVYLYRLDVDKNRFTQTRKMVLMR